MGSYPRCKLASINANVNPKPPWEVRDRAQQDGPPISEETINGKAKGWRTGDRYAIQIFTNLWKNTQNKIFIMSRAGGILQVSPQLVLRLQWMNIFSSFSSSKAQVILVHPASASPPLILQLSHRVKYISNISLFWRKHKMYEIHKWWEKWKYQSTSGKKQKFRAPLLCCDCGQFMVHIGRMIYGCWEYSDAQPIQDCKPVSVQPACSCWWKINCMNGKISEKGKIMGRKV